MEERLLALAARQGGAFSCADALDLGETRRTLRTLMARGWLRRSGRAYVVRAVPPGGDNALWAAQLAIGPPVAFTSAAAARCHGLGVGSLDLRLRALVPAGRVLPSLPAVSVHGVVPSELAGMRTLRGHPVTSLAVTLRWLALDVPARELEDAVAGVLLRRTTTVGILRASLGRGRTGSAALRAALAAVGDESQSRAERALARLIGAHGLPPPLRHAELRGRDGKVYRPDFFWGWARLGAEVDGWAVHGTREAFGYDRARANRILVEHGIELLRYPADRIRDDPRGVVAELTAALRQRGWSA